MVAMRKLSFAIGLVVLIGALPAFAADATRETYKEAVEPICKANTEANEKILKGVRAKVNSGKLDAAAKQFRSAARALKRARTQLLQVPQPPADTAQLTKWLGYVKTEIELFEAAARKLANGEQNSAVRMVVRLRNTANQANNQVADFGFRYCKFQPSKFI